MTIIAVLIAIGSLLIFAETLLMMGVLFAIAVCMFAVAAAVAFSKFGALSAMGVGGAFIAVCVFAMLVWSKVIPKTKFAKEIYLKKSDRFQSAFPKCFVVCRAGGDCENAPMPVRNCGNRRALLRRLLRRRPLPSRRKSLRSGGDFF